MDELRQICVGCFRTGEEITRWTAYSIYERRAILQRLRTAQKPVTK